MTPAPRPSPLPRALASALAVASLLACAPALAAPPEEVWSTTVEATTELPLSTGARLLVESPGGVRFGLGLGLLPASYVDIINSTVVGLGGYDEQVAELIALSLDDSVVLRVDLGFRPVPDIGLYLQGGYRLVHFGGVVDGPLVASLIDEELPSDGDYAYDIRSSLHMAELEVGYQWDLPYGLTLHAGAGFAATFKATSSVEAILIFDQFLQRIEVFLDQLYTSYAFTPTLTLGAGYSFR